MQFTDHTNNYGDLCFGTRGAIGYSEKMRIDSGGALKLNTYTLTQQTGASAYLLGVDASGNVVQSTNIPAGSGGTAGPYLPLAGGTMTTTAKIQFYNANQYIHANSTNCLLYTSPSPRD